MPFQPPICCKSELRDLIFEGAFLAWCGLGQVKEKKKEHAINGKQFSSARGRRYLLRQIRNDYKDGTVTNGTSTGDVDTKVVSYRALPSAGLAHPYVEAILKTWLASKEDDRKVAFTILRRWWSYRRKGESPSVRKLMDMDRKMKKTLNDYKRYFFCLAQEQQLDQDEEQEENEEPESRVVSSSLSKKRSRNRTDVFNQGEQRNSKKRKIDLHQTQKAARISSDVDGDQSKIIIVASSSSSISGGSVSGNSSGDESMDSTVHITTPPAPSSEVDHLIAFTVSGMTSVHCVTIIEAILRGCSGNKSPIGGLVDAVTDYDHCMVLIKIDDKSKAGWIVMQVTNYLNVMGYSAKAVHCQIDGKHSNDVQFFEVDKTNCMIFDWKVSCTCTYPRSDDSMKQCLRHSQISKFNWETFSVSSEKKLRVE